MPDTTPFTWRDAAIIVARLIFAGAFALAWVFKLMDIPATAGYIASVGFPFATLLAWLAAIFEMALTIAFLTGAYFTEAALLAGAYVIFLGFAFHGPQTWEGNPMEFGFFVDHFTFLAGLLLAAVLGPGRRLAARAGLMRRAPPVE